MTYADGILAILLAQTQINSSKREVIEESKSLSTCFLYYPCIPLFIFASLCFGFPFLFSVHSSVLLTRIAWRGHTLFDIDIDIVLLCCLHEGCTMYGGCLSFFVFFICLPSTALMPSLVFVLFLGTETQTQPNPLNHGYMCFISSFLMFATAVTCQ